MRGSGEGKDEPMSGGGKSKIYGHVIEINVIRETYKHKEERAPWLAVEGRGKRGCVS